MDSPTRRSSIPILKQTNKTKTFQSYVNLNLNDDNKSESSSSSCTSPSISVSRDPPKLPTKNSNLNLKSSSSVELDIESFAAKLLEENKRLKEHQQSLVTKYEEGNGIFNFLYTVYESLILYLYFVRNICTIISQFHKINNDLSRF